MGCKGGEEIAFEIRAERSSPRNESNCHKFEFVTEFVLVRSHSFYFEGTELCVSPDPY